MTSKETGCNEAYKLKNYIFMFNFNGKTNVNIIVNSRLKIHNYNNPSVHNFRLRRRRLVAIKLEQITRPLIVCEITMIFT